MKSSFVSLGGKASQKRKALTSCTTTLNTPGDHRPAGLRKHCTQKSDNKEEVPSHPQNPETCKLSPVRSNSKMPMLCSRPLQGSPFLRAGWLFPECLPMRACREQRRLIHDSDSIRIPERPVLALQGPGICQFCLCANPALLGVLWL